MPQLPLKETQKKLPAFSLFLPIGLVWLPAICVLLYCWAQGIPEIGLIAVLLVSAAAACILTAAALLHYRKPLSRILSRCSADTADGLSEPERLDAAFQAQDARLRQQDDRLAVYLVRDILAGVRIDEQLAECCFPESRYRSFCVAVVSPQLPQAQSHTLAEKLADSLPGKAVVFTPTLEKETLVVYAAADTVEPQQLAASLQKCLRRITRQSHALHVGAAVSSITRLGRSYSSAFADTAPTAASYPRALLTAFDEQLRSGSQHQLLSVLQQLEDALPQLEPAEQHALCLQTLHTYLRVSGSQPDGPDAEKAAYAGSQQLFRMIKHAITNLSGPAPDAEQGAASEIQAVLLDYVDQNCLDSALCLNSAADYLNTSIYAVSRIFKDTTGVGFKEYITGKRLQYACHLLETTRKTVSTIAAESGFENSTYFTTVFKNEYGIPPSKYRTNALRAPENEEA